MPDFGLRGAEAAAQGSTASVAGPGFLAGASPAVFRHPIAGKAGARPAFVLGAAGRRPVPAGEVVSGDTGPDAEFRAGRSGPQGGEIDRIGEYRAAIGGAGVMTKNVLKLQHFQITGHPGRKIRKLWLIRALAGTLRFVIQHTTG